MSMSSNHFKRWMDCHPLKGDVPLYAVDAEGNRVVRNGQFVPVGSERCQIGWEWVCKMEACGPSIVIQRDETETDANCPVISVGIGRTKKEARDRVERFQPAEVEHVLKVLKAALSDHKDS